jgi:hypothetical protein
MSKNTDNLNQKCHDIADESCVLYLGGDEEVIITLSKSCIFESKKIIEVTTITTAFVQIVENIEIDTIVVDISYLGDGFKLADLKNLLQSARDNLMFGFYSIFIYDTSDQKKLLEDLGEKFICHRDDLVKTIQKIGKETADATFDNFGYG